MSNVDVLVVGAGPVGAVVAERAAAHGYQVMVIDRRPHLGGNCYDSKEQGVLVHRYGPHYFRTDSDLLLAYLSRFTGWIPARYVVKASHRGKLFPIPVNRTTLEEYFGIPVRTPEDATRLLEQVRVPFAEPANAEEFALSRVGRALYEAFLLGYTEKQWGRHPRELAPWLLGRLPVRIDTDDRYVTAQHQVMPADGYTALFQRMLAHDLIQVRLGVGYDDIRGRVAPRVGIVYTGPLDEYFGRDLGPLPWRSLRFEFQAHEQELVQPCVQVNYPDADVPYTRTVESKHVTGQRHQHTVVATEYPSATGDPYYPVPETSAAALAARYADRAGEETRRARVWFAGRLAEYRYLNMDEAFLRGLAVWEEIRIAQSRPASSRTSPRRGR